MKITTGIAWMTTGAGPINLGLLLLQFIYDGNKQLIYDPRKAANSPYGPDYKFVSFMMIFTNIIDGLGSPHSGTK